jgi:hypothetical protein
VPTIICPQCRTENQPAGLSALTCESCHRTIDPRRVDSSAKVFIRRQRKLRKKSGVPLEQDEAVELLEWVLGLPPDDVGLEEDAEPQRGGLRRLIGLLARPWHWRMATARRPRHEWLYTDTVVRMGEERIVINRYYWPVGRKRIPYTAIRGFTARPLNPWHGQFRVHGIDHRGRWYSRDRHRGEKERAIDLAVGKLIHPVLTPDDIDMVLGILERKVTNDPG